MRFELISGLLMSLTNNALSVLRFAAGSCASMLVRDFLQAQLLFRNFLAYGLVEELFGDFCGFGCSGFGFRFGESYLRQISTTLVSALGDFGLTSFMDAAHGPAY